MKKNLPLLICLLVACPPAGMAGRAEAGSVQFSTYYPAPFGMYDRLRLVPRATLNSPCDPGTFYYNTGVGLRLCDENSSWWPLGGVWKQNSVNNYIYPADTATNPNLKVGIGTTAPNNFIQVKDLINFDNANFTTALGYQAGKVNTGNYNIFVGYNAGLANTTGIQNTFIGYTAGRANTGGDRNAFIGDASGRANTSGQRNTFIGENTGKYNTTGFENTFVGSNAGSGNDDSPSSTGSNNTFVGGYSGYGNTTGGSNTFLGRGSGSNNTTGSSNILIGLGVNAPLATSSNFLNIGNTIYGNLSTGNVGIGTTASGARLTVADQNNAGVALYQYNAGDGANVRGYRARGTIAIPAQVLADDRLSALSGYGYTNAGSFAGGPSASVNLYASEAFTATANGTYISFRTTANATAANAERMRIDNAGNVGIGTATPRTRLELGNDGAILAAGTLGSGWTEPNIGAGTRLLWYPGKAAFRAGSVDGAQWDNTQIGNYSVAMGFNTAAGGMYSTALGVTTTAQALASVVLGQYNVISGNSSSWVATDPLFVIGNGTSSAARANALTILKNGNAGIGITSPSSTLQVGDPGNSTNEYAQIDSFLVPGAPPATDCNSDTQLGRMILQVNGGQQNLWVCAGTSGWMKSALAP